MTARIASTLVALLAFAGAHAAVHVEEAWDYTISGSYRDGDDSGGLNGGTGWSGAWQYSYAPTLRVYSNSAAYADMNTVGHRGQVGWDGAEKWTKRYFSSSQGTDGSTLWVAWLQRKSSDWVRSDLLVREDATTTIQLALRSDNNTGNHWGLTVGTNVVSTSAPWNQMTLVVFKVNCVAGDDDVDVWMNPVLTNSLATIEASPDYSFPAVTNISLGNIVLWGGLKSSGWCATMDEFRIADTFREATASIEPTPPAEGSVVRIW